jgi:hypothetical protein
VTGQTSGNDRQIFGKLGSVSLNDIIQLLGMSKRTATLELRSGAARGRLYFRDGQIIHATAGTYEGEESYIELLGWADAEFAIEEGIAALPKVSITKSTEALMLSTATTLDEIDRLKGNVPIRVAPSITQPRRPPRPQRGARRRSFSKNTTLVAGAVTLLVGSLLSGSLTWTWLASSNSEESLWQHLPSVDSPSWSSPVAFEVDAWSVAKAVWDRRALVPATPKMIPAEPAALVAGDITIVVEPWARIEIDGVAVGETPLGKLTLAPGAHRITLVNDHIVGHIQDDIFIEPGESLVKRYSFGDVGYLRLVATPWANVSVDGRVVGQTPLGSIAVPAGAHSVHFIHPELGETTREIDVVSGQTTLVRVQLQ